MLIDRISHFWVEKSKNFALANSPVILTMLIMSVLLTACGSPIVPNSTTAVVATSSPIIMNSNPIPLFAYYYIWFDFNSWDRAKKDFPLLGRYSSDDVNVMRQHIKWAKSAGINGFFVSWKSTDKLNSRLSQLIRIADEENFKLAIIYQGLDFNRNPLPAERVAADIDYFISNYASDVAFKVFDKPLIIWSGTWKFTRDQVQSVTKGRRDRLLILASEKNVNDYQGVADLVDGDAYYWSSVNPDTYPKYPEKLAAMGQAVHARGGLWLAPAAAGFDATDINGKTIVDRKDGKTLQIEMKAALQSSPDAIGLISWNEFSENSYIEPSENFGYRYTEVLTDIDRTNVSAIGDFDSSEPGIIEPDYAMSLGVQLAIGLIVTMVITSGIVLIRRH
jgi:hypothetical protein